MDFVGGKRQKLDPKVPEWELKLEFDPSQLIPNSRKVEWVDYRGKPLQSPSPHPSAEKVAEGGEFNLEHLPFRNPDYYVAGNLHDQAAEWGSIGAGEEVLSWLKNGVDVQQFFKHFKGNFKGQHFNNDLPPQIFLPNAPSCIGFGNFIIETLIERILNGSMSVIGKVGDVQPPHLVMPITIEPSKPRLCHDERFLNLWVKDLPFVLDTLKEVSRVVPVGSYMTTVDDKSGYDHILLSSESRKYFGVQFGGWYLVCNTIPFGFKASAYIYNTTGLVATGFCRGLGVPCLQYIDDRLIGELGVHGSSGLVEAQRALYVVCEVLTRLGYFIGLSKSFFEPSQIRKFLGLVIDSQRQTFVVPEDKREKFAALRDSILEKQYVDLLSLQRFAGKCISFMLAVPAAKLFIREVNRAISASVKNSRPVKISNDLRGELSRWKFLDSWEGCVPWKQEKHLQINLATDASSFRWGAVIGNHQVLGDFFRDNDTRPIHLKEAEGLYQAINVMSSQLENHRVDAHVDNQAVVAAWEGQGCKCPELNNYVKKIFDITYSKNIDLKVHYIPSLSNPADAESRRLTLQDSMLSPKA